MLLRIIWNKRFILTCVAIFLSLACTNTTLSDCTYLLQNLVGWTIIDSKTITGCKDPGEEKNNNVTGCDFNRIIYFSDGTTATCNSYGYQFAFWPTAIIIGQGGTYNGRPITLYKMIVEDQVYDIH